MSTLSSKDRVSLCAFTFADGRRCRTPRSDSHPHFCFYHARKEAQAKAASQIGDDVAFFFSGEYISACDLSLALARLFTAVADGQLKPKTASTLAYLAQTLLQTIHLAEHEFTNTFDGDGWRARIRHSVAGNFNYRFPQPEPPPAPEPVSPPPPPPQPASSASPQPVAVSAVAHPFRDEASPPASPQPAAQSESQTADQPSRQGGE
jgi:hypothetical protein